MAPNAVAPTAVAVTQPSNGTVGAAISMSAPGAVVTRTAAPTIVQPQSAASVGNVASINQVPTVATAQVCPKIILLITMLNKAVCSILPPFPHYNIASPILCDLDPS